jgi:hypothetical protein
MKTPDMINTKPHVGIIYSRRSINSQCSFESEHIAKYLCGILSNSGYTYNVLIPFDPAGDFLTLPTDRIVYIPPDEKKPVTSPTSDYEYAYMSALSTCHVVCICVAQYDTTACLSRMTSVNFDDNYATTVFMMQHGALNNQNALSDLSADTSKKWVILDGAVCFSVVPSADIFNNGALVSIPATPAIVVERLSKDQVKTCEGPCNLLEHTGLNVLYRKETNVMAWGSAVVEFTHALSTLYGESLAETMCDPCMRLAAAVMAREVSIVTSKAARDGKWVPRFEAHCFWHTIWSLEMMYVCPTWLYLILSYLFGPSFDSNASPGTIDLDAGRPIICRDALKNVEAVAQQFGLTMPMCGLVEKCLEKISINQSGNLRACRNTCYKSIYAYLYSRDKVVASVTEWRFYALRFLALLSGLLVIFSLFLL